MHTPNCTRCGAWLFFGDKPTCRACHEKTEKIRHLSNRYQRQRKNPGFSIRFAVIDLRFRQRLTVSEIVKILGITEDRVLSEIDIAIQDAR